VASGGISKVFISLLLVLFNMLINYSWEKGIGPILSLNLNNKEYGICFCHRNKDRTVNIFGLEKLLCSRCLGILLGGLVGSLLHFLGYHIPLKISILLAIPLLVDGFSQYLELRQSNNIFRIITGLLFGLSLNYIGVLF